MGGATRGETRDQKPETQGEFGHRLTRIDTDKTSRRWPAIERTDKMNIEHPISKPGKIMVPESEAGVNWSDLQVMSDAAVNWADLSYKIILTRNR